MLDHVNVPGITGIPCSFVGSPRPPAADFITAHVHHVTQSNMGVFLSQVQQLMLSRHATVCETL